MKKWLFPLVLLTAFCAGFINQVHANDNNATESVAQYVSAKVNINTAGVDELQALPGVGPKKAAAIVAYRQQVGEFTAVEELLEVKGIGDAMLNKLADKVVTQ